MTEQTQNAAQHEDNKLIAERRAKLAALREQGNPFPNDFRRDATAAELQAKQLAPLGATCRGQEYSPHR